MSLIEVSVIVVIRNEENFVVNCIRSICNQFNIETNWELILVNSCSTDKSMLKAEQYLGQTSINYKILENEKKILSSGWNIGIKEAKGKFVIRPDAHSELINNYIMTGVTILQNNNEITAVGGRLITEGKGFWGGIIKEALSSKVCVGNSSFRTNKKDGFVDTAVYAVYRKEIFDKVGYFNENLVRHQDNEMHERIHAVGGKFYLSTKMRAIYFCRGNIPSLLKQMYAIGIYLPNAGIKSLKIRHLIPFAFLIFLFVGAGISIFSEYIRMVYITTLLFYLTVIFIEFSNKSIRNGNLPLMLNVAIVPLIHIAYGFGTLIGFFNLFKKTFSVKRLFVL